MSGQKNRTSPKAWWCAATLAVLLGLGGSSSVWAQQGEAKGESKGENFSAKPAAQLFASDCTGAGCHKGPQGLAKNGGIGLAGFLREHYTNSRESAAALAAYLTNIPSGPAPREARKPQQGRQASPSPSSGPAGWFESSPGEPAARSKQGEAKPGEAKQGEAKPGRRAPHTAARHEEPASPSSQRHDLGGEPSKPASRERPQHNRPSPAASAAAPSSPAGEPAPAVAAAPAPMSEPAAAPAAAAQAPAPAETPAPPAKKQFDIFD